MGTGKGKRGGFEGHEFVWFRITVVVACLGYCAGEALVWLHV